MDGRCWARERVWVPGDHIVSSTSSRRRKKERAEQLSIWQTKRRHIPFNNWLFYHLLVFLPSIKRETLLFCLFISFIIDRLLLFPLRHVKCIYTLHFPLACRSIETLASCLNETRPIIVERAYSARRRWPEEEVFDSLRLLDNNFPPFLPFYFSFIWAFSLTFDLSPGVVCCVWLFCYSPNPALPVG